jgi:hypothetical protein
MQLILVNLSVSRLLPVCNAFREDRNGACALAADLFQEKEIVAPRDSKSARDDLPDPRFREKMGEKRMRRVVCVRHLPKG